MQGPMHNLDQFVFNVCVVWLLTGCQLRLLGEQSIRCLPSDILLEACISMIPETCCRDGLPDLLPPCCSLKKRRRCKRSRAFKHRRLPGTTDAGACSHAVHDDVS